MINQRKHQTYIERASELFPGPLSGKPYTDYDSSEIELRYLNITSLEENEDM